MRGLVVTALLGSIVLAGPAQAQGRFQRFNPFNRGDRPPPTTTYMPSRDFEEWVANNLDIRSFNSSIDNRREAYQARLREVGYAPVPRRGGRGPVIYSLSSADGDISLSVFQRGDANHDGIEDVVLCFDDSLKNGRYHRVQTLLAQKYSASGPLVALDVQVSDPRCREN